MERAAFHRKVITDNEQIINKLHQADVDLASGATVEQVCKKLEVSQQTYYRWRHQFGGLKAEDMRRLKELERENQRLKKLVADQAIDISILKEVSRGKF